jgi:hypothetical protein
MMEHKSPQDRLSVELEAVKRWKRLSEMEKSRAIRHFMHEIGRLYLDYFQSHLQEAKAFGNTQQALLKSELKTIYNLYVLELWSKLDGEDELADLWETYCCLHEKQIGTSRS